MNPIHLKKGGTLPTNPHDVAFMQVAFVYKGMITIN